MNRHHVFAVASLALVAACEAPYKEPPISTAPLLETLPAHYRPINRQDTLESYWAPYEDLEDSLFQYTEAHRSLVLVRAQFVPASAMHQNGLDTLTFQNTFHDSHLNRTGYHWYFGYHHDTQPEVTRDTNEEPQRLALPITNRLLLTEYRRWKTNDAVYDRNSYSVDYPFHTVAIAPVSDSVVYVRAYPLRPNVPRPDTLYTYFHQGEKKKRLPCVADVVDSTYQATIRFSFRVLRHSPNLD